MGDPKRLRPDEVETFVTRELRKAGLELTTLKVRSRQRLSKENDDYSMELSGVMRVGGANLGVLVECRNEAGPVGKDAVRALSGKLTEARVPHAIMFSTSGFHPEAVGDAQPLGIPLLTVADGKSAFARSAWGMAGQPPAWVPEYMSELVDVDRMGQLRHQLIVSGNAALILNRLRKEQTP